MFRLPALAAAATVATQATLDLPAARLDSWVGLSVVALLTAGASGGVGGACTGASTAPLDNRGALPSTGANESGLRRPLNRVLSLRAGGGAHPRATALLGQGW